MISVRDQFQAALAPLPLAVTLLAFVLGYQARAAFTPVVVAQATPAVSGRKRASSQAKDGSSPETNANANANANTNGKGKGKGKSSLTPSSASASGSEWEGATDTDSEAEDEAAANAADISSIKAKATEEVKLVLVVNDSLKMTKGKIGAQCGHATLACYETLARSNPGLISKWKMQGQPKIALRCADTEELEALAKQARALNLCARTIQDAGRTQVAPGSRTVLGVGPGPARLINQVTGKLKLL